MILRICAAAAAAITALLLQLTLIGPVLPLVPASLPAVLVAAVAIAGGAGPGLTMGFAVGLLADLSSPHPVGLMAAIWLLLGAAVGRHADPRRSRLSAWAIAAVGATLAGLLGQVAVAGFAGAPVDLLALPWRGVQTLIADAALLAVVLPPVRSALGRLSPPRLGIQRV
jgi:rod shape-determining protein MreD